MPRKRRCLDPSREISEVETVTPENVSNVIVATAAGPINDKECSVCKKTFQNDYNRKRHEQNIHKINDPSQPSTSASTTPTTPLSSKVSTPVGRRTRNASKQKTPSGWNRIFNYEGNPELSRLRDEAIRDQQAYAKRQEALRREKVEERRKAMEERRKVLAARNVLAEENERARKEQEELKKKNSERAISNLIESRKRRR